MGEGGGYLVAARFVGDIFYVSMDVVHWVGHGGDVLLGCAGAGVVLDLICHVERFEFEGWRFGR